MKDEKQEKKTKVGHLLYSAIQPSAQHRTGCAVCVYNTKSAVRSFCTGDLSQLLTVEDALLHFCILALSVVAVVVNHWLLLTGNMLEPAIVKTKVYPQFGAESACIVVMYSFLFADC